MRTALIAKHRWLLWLALLGASTGSVAWGAHPFHSSHGEAEWNRESMMLEVALALDAGDLERAVRDHADVDFLLEAPEMQPALWGYVQDRFGVGKGQAQAPLRWVGLEVLDDGTAWVYFEVKLAETPTGPLRVTHRLLLESSDGQQNFLTLKVGNHAETRVFTRKRPDFTFGLEAERDLVEPK